MKNSQLDARPGGHGVLRRPIVGGRPHHRPTCRRGRCAELVFAGAEEDVAVTHSGAELLFKTEDEGAAGSLLAGIDSAQLEANIQLPDLMQVSETELASLSGMLQLQMPVQLSQT